MTNILVSKYEAIHDVFSSVIVDGLPLEYWKLEKKYFSELREPTVVLFVKCEKENQYGGCEKEELLTVGYFDNAYCETVQSDIIHESDWFCVLGDYPIDDSKKDIILQVMFNLNNELKYPIQNPIEKNSNQ